MKLLRETIRRILFENQRFFDNILDLICKQQTVAHINQALELALTMKYIYKLKTSTNEQYDYRTYHWHFHIHHRGFETTLVQRMRELAIQTSGHSPVTLRQPMRESGVFSITLKEYKPKPR